MKLLKQLGGLVVVFLLLATGILAFAAVDGTGFADVSADAWYAEAVVYCRDHGLISGISEDRFAPESELTRAQLAAVLYRLAGSPAVSGTDAFADTADGGWYSSAVLWASQAGFISGYGNRLFGPEDPVSREQMTAILWRYAGSPSSSAVNSYHDQAEIAGYASAAVDWSSANSIVAAAAGSIFAPKRNAVRAEVADALMNLDRMQNRVNAAAPSPAPQPESVAGDRVLVAYFSATNHTENIANHLTAVLHADCYEIMPEQPYTSADLDYDNASSRASQEMNDPDARPAIAGNVENMAQYDVIYLGYPIWWGQAPKIINTFLESYDFSGKTIVPFCTSASSGIGTSAENLHPFASAAAWLEGRRFGGDASSSEVETWVDGLPLG